MEVPDEEVKMPTKDTSSQHLFDYSQDDNPCSLEYARALDELDPLRHLRDEFIIPTKRDLNRKTLSLNGTTLFPFSIHPRLGSKANM